jgi:hypothetical protein
MHAAPTVTYPVGRSRFAGALLLVAWLAGLAACVSWWLAMQSPGWRLAVAGFALSVAGIAAARLWWQCPVGELRWDGAAWHWSGRGGVTLSALEVGLDLQGQMLVRCRYGKSTQWLWLERSRRAHRWDDLRRAVYSRARPDALRQAMPPAAKP